MTRLRRVLLVAMMFGALHGFAGAKDLLISFSTVGPDRYADGTTVKDGEWYALCWTTNAVFGGLTTTGVAAVAGECVLLTAPLATAGHCPYTVFHLSESEKLSGGRYIVCLLDTRDANGVPTKTRLGANARVPTMLNGAIATAEARDEATHTTSASAISGTWDETKVDTASADYAQVKISAIEVSGDRVRLTVSGMMPGLRYNIKSGAQVTNLTTFALDVPLTKDAQEDVPFLLEKSEARFFTVEREPLAR